MPAPPTSPAPSTGPYPARSTRLIVAAALTLASAAGLAFTSVFTDRSPIQAAAPTAIALPLVNLNTATAAELDLLPRIGPTLSARIVEDRDQNGPFETIEALDRVKGIGPRTILRLRPHITVE